MLNKISIFYGIFISLGFSTLAGAADFHSPRTASLGGAGHASPLLSDAIYLNPSFTPFTNTHAFSFNYLTYGGNPVNTVGGISDFYGHNMNFSILDGSAEAAFQAGVGYTRRDDSSMIHVGAAKNITQKLGAGLGGKFIFPNNNAGERITDATLSMSGVFTTWFQTALIVDNLFESGVNRGFYREYIAGTKFNVMGIVLAYVDPHWVPSLPLTLSTNKTQWGYEAGLEFPFYSDFFLRFGNFMNASVPFQAQRGDGFAAGIGWLGPKLSFDYSYNRVIGPLSSFAHNFGTTLFF